MTDQTQTSNQPASLGFFARLGEDIHTALARDPAARNGFEVATLYPGIHAIWLHRISHWLWKHGLFWPARALSNISRFFTGIEIHPGAQIGRRFFIDHGMGVVIGETSIIGDDVTIYHNVTLGGVSLEKVKRHPTIEPGVVIGTGAKVLGDITIGAHSRVGANAVVVKSVPPQSVVVGVPGQVIKRRHDEPEELTDLRHEDLPDAVVESLQDIMFRLAIVESELEIKPQTKSTIQLEKDGTWDYVNDVDYEI